MHRPFIILIILIVWLPAIWAKGQVPTELMLHQLDSVVADRDKYVEAKLARLNEMHRELAAF